MIDDCMAGKIDKIICKSISRFARNTEDCLHYVRKLKDKGIAVYFETENIDTLGSGGELYLQFLAEWHRIVVETNLMLQNGAF